MLIDKRQIFLNWVLTQENVKNDEVKELFKTKGDDEEKLLDLNVKDEKALPLLQSLEP